MGGRPRASTLLRRRDEACGPPAQPGAGLAGPCTIHYWCLEGVLGLKQAGTAE